MTNINSTHTHTLNQIRSTGTNNDRFNSLLLGKECLKFDMSISLVLAVLSLKQLYRERKVCWCIDVGIGQSDRGHSGACETVI